MKNSEVATSSNYICTVTMLITIATTTTTRLYICIYIYIYIYKPILESSTFYFEVET